MRVLCQHELGNERHFQPAVAVLGGPDRATRAAMASMSTSISSTLTSYPRHIIWRCRDAKPVS
jgi:hypothetical protein